MVVGVLAERCLMPALAAVFMIFLFFLQLTTDAGVPSMAMAMAAANTIGSSVSISM